MLLHILDRDKVTARIEHDSAVAESGGVLNVYARSHPCHTIDGCAAFHLGGQQLQEALHGVEQPLWGARLGRDLVFRYLQCITFFMLYRFVDQ